MGHTKTPMNPSRSATRRVRDKLPTPDICHYCAGAVSIAGHKDIYSRNYGNWPWVYLCVSCGAYVGMHPFTNIPLGTLADKATRAARLEGKASFLSLVKSGADKKAAYAALAEELGIPVGECHFGWFDVSMCRKAQAKCEARTLDGTH